MNKMETAHLLLHFKQETEKKIREDIDKEQNEYDHDHWSKALDKVKAGKAKITDYICTPAGCKDNEQQLIQEVREYMKHNRMKITAYKQAITRVKQIKIDQ